MDWEVLLMKRRFLSMVLAILLIMATVIAPVSASAASKVKIMRVTTDGARVRKGPGNYDVVTSVKKGSKVFYLGKTKTSFVKVRTSTGTTGYMYKGFLKAYGTCYKSQVYYSKKKNLAMYKKASTRSSKRTRLSKKQHVIVYQVKGSWAYVKTLGGTGGFVKKKYLKKAF